MIMKCKFKTAYSSTPRFSSCVGSTTRDNYIEVFSSSGVPTLEYSDSTDLIQLVNQCAESCKISAIVNRYLMGDTSALSYRPVEFVDCGDTPTNLIDMYNTIQKTKAKFDQFSAAQKEAYNNSFGQFLSSLNKESEDGLSESSNE